MRPDVVGVILAGGQSRRMGGGDKALKLLAGRPILNHVIDRVRGQVGALVLNANGDPGRFAAYRLPVVPDGVDGFAGPLAGVLAGLDWAAANAVGATRVASFPCDAPFLPADLVERLVAAVAAARADLGCAASAGRAHPVVGLWPLRLRADLRR
ncbi:MAG: molybdenum cofactor guanylyltransferase MobA, partial [Alphaproteobacteria bacterium]